MARVQTVTRQTSGVARFTSYLFGNRPAVYPAGLLYPEIRINGRAMIVIANNPPPCETVADPLNPGQSIVRPIIPGANLWDDALAYVTLNGLRVPVTTTSLLTLEQGIFIPYGQQNFRIEQEFDRFQVQLLVNPTSAVMIPHSFTLIVEHPREIENR